MSDTKEPGKGENTGTEGTKAASAESPKSEISGAAVARMMGIASSVELKILESKVDLVASRLTSLSVKLEKVIGQFGSLPSGSDLERIDVQIGSLKGLVRDLLVTINAEKVNAGTPAQAKSNETEIVTADEGTPAEARE